MCYLKLGKANNNEFNNSDTKLQLGSMPVLKLNTHIILIEWKFSAIQKILFVHTIMITGINHLHKQGQFQPNQQ